MATWIVFPQYSKTIEEHEIFTRDGVFITHVTGWRSGSWQVETSGDELPDFEFDAVPGGDGKVDSLDMLSIPGSNIESVDIIETQDGWTDYFDFPNDISEEDQSQIEEAWENASYEGLEDLGWHQADTEMWIWGPIEVQNESGKTVAVIDPEHRPQSGKDPVDRIASLAGVKQSEAPALTAIPGFPTASKNLIALVNQVPADRRQAALADIQKVAKMGATEAQIIASLKKDYLK